MKTENCAQVWRKKGQLGLALKYAIVAVLNKCLTQVRLPLNTCAPFLSYHLIYISCLLSYFFTLCNNLCKVIQLIYRTKKRLQPDWLSEWRTNNFIEELRYNIPIAHFSLVRLHTFNSANISLGTSETRTKSNMRTHNIYSTSITDQG